MRLQPKLFLIITPPAILSMLMIFFSVYHGMYDKADQDVRQVFELKLDSVVARLNALDTVEPAATETRDIIIKAIDEDVARILLVSQNANVAFDSSHKMTGHTNPTLLNIPWPHDDVVVDDTLGFTDSLLFRYRLVNGENLIAFLSEARIVASIAPLAKTLALAAFLGTIMGIVMFFVLLRFIVLNPLITVRETAMKIGDPTCAEGDNFASVIHRSDEIGDLARAIHSTSLRLTTSYEELQLSHQEIERLAYRDALTDLPNRRMYYKAVSKRIDDVKDRYPLYVLFVDIHDFKQVNDLLGHESGDELLCAISRRLLACLNIADPMLCELTGHCVARLGGDEFVIMVSGEDGSETGESVAREILAALSIPIVLQDQSFTVRASVGIAVYPEDGSCVADLITSADTAMYEAKKNRHSHFEHYTESMRSDLESKRKLELNLKEAIARKELFLNYQPKYSLNDLSLKGAEALLRWQHPVEGLVPPDKFIPIAEECGLIGEIGAWVLDEACRQWAQWHASGIGIEQLAVNVSIRQFAANNIFELVCDTLKKHNMPPGALELELTESCVVEALDEVLVTLTALRKHGVKIAMDDFGTGYSSLGGIANLPIDTLKLDRSFITRLSPGSPNEKIVNSVLMMARGLNLSVVAEGIENQIELDCLREGECDLAQGYLLSRPLSAVVMSELLEKQHPVIARRSA